LLLPLFLLLLFILLFLFFLTFTQAVAAWDARVQ
jgi:hypothetical protein